MRRPRDSVLAPKPIALPGAAGGVILDYLAVDRAARRVWIPAGSTGSVDVIDGTSAVVKRIEGFATAPAEVFGKKAAVGPSAVTLGDGFA
jgi:hypothetical protein